MAALDFPNSPVLGQVYTANGVSWQWDGTYWQSNNPGGGGGGGGVEEAPANGQYYARRDLAWAPIPPTLSDAPNDGKLYGRRSAAWSEVVIPTTIAWTSVTGKPATFPPTVPIAWTDLSGVPSTFPPSAHTHPTSEVTGLDAALAGKEPAIAAGDPTYIWYGDKTWKPAPAGGGGSVAWADITGKPSTFPPTVPIAQADIANLTFDLAAKAPLASPTFTGDPRAPTPATSDNDTSVATTAFVKAQGYLTSSALNAYVPLTGNVTMTGPLTISYTLSNFTLDDTGGTTAGNWSVFNWKRGGLARWAMFLDTNESGSNNGANWTVARYSDAGAWLGNVFSVNRATGILNFAVTPTVAGVPIGGGGGLVSVSDTPPASPTDGQVWFESDSGGLFLRYNDGNSTAWVQVNAKGLADAPADGKAYVRKDASYVDLMTIAPPLPTATAGVPGQWVAFNSANGAALAAPAGGTWACITCGYTNATLAWSHIFQANVVPGGTVIRAAQTGIVFLGFGWRIA
jgi:hypothetical protein